ncbi:MAG: hypothetical protein ACKVQK_31505 [Burkholderiales bacterium]
MTTNEMKQLIEEKYQTEFNAFCLYMTDEINIEAMKYANSLMTVERVASMTVTVKTFFATLAMSSFVK